MAKRIFTVFFVSILSLGYLSVELVPSGDRRLASCVEPVAEANILPLPSGLFGEIKDEVLKKSAMDYYIFLSKVEMQALAGRQSIRAMYGIKDAAPTSVFPDIVSFNPNANAFATGFLWGSFGNYQAPTSFTVGASLPGTLATQPSATAGAAAGLVKKPEGILFPPYGQQAMNRQATYSSPVMGTFLPSANAANNRIGTFK